VHVFVVADRMKPIPVTDFSEYVAMLHANRDKLFDVEFEVSRCGQSEWCHMSHVFMHVLVSGQRVHVSQ